MRRSAFFVISRTRPNPPGSATDGNITTGAGRGSRRIAAKGAQRCARLRGTSWVRSGVAASPDPNSFRRQPHTTCCFGSRSGQPRLGDRRYGGWLACSAVVIRDTGSGSCMTTVGRRMTAGGCPTRHCCSRSSSAWACGRSSSGPSIACCCRGGASTQAAADRRPRLDGRSRRGHRSHANCGSLLASASASCSLLVKACLRISINLRQIRRPCSSMSAPAEKSPARVGTGGATRRKSIKINAGEYAAKPSGSVVNERIRIVVKPGRAASQL